MKINKYVDSLTKLTLSGSDLVDDTFRCVEEFWDCECNDYIKPKSSYICKDCKCCADEYPDSRLIEVIEQFPKLVWIKWYYGAGGEANKNYICESALAYINSLK